MNPHYEQVHFDQLINGSIYYCFNQHGYYIGIFDHYSTKAKFKQVRFISENEMIEMDHVMIDSSYNIYKTVR